MVDLAKIHGAAITNSKVAIRACFDDDAHGDPKEAAKILSLFEEIYTKNKKTGTLLLIAGIPGLLVFFFGVIFIGMGIGMRKKADRQLQEVAQIYQTWLVENKK